MKKCSICKKYKEELKFYIDKRARSGLQAECKECHNASSNNYYNHNKNKIKLTNKKYYKQYPWLKTLQHIKTRCNNPHTKDYKNYYGRGIKCLITNEELKVLWFRDRAYLMKQPTIDRIDNNGNYTINNCQFIEMKVNQIKDRYKTILQYDLQGKFIREWESIKEASIKLKISSGHISDVASGKRKTCGGFIWKYKEETHE